MEAEAEKLKVLQSEVEKQMSMGSLFKFSPNRSTTVVVYKWANLHFFEEEDRGR